MTQLPLNPQLANCPNCGEREKIWIHSQKERRFKCVSCGRTFAETSGTIFYQLQYPMWLVVVVVTLLAYGCPVPAIVAAFALEERTVVSWLSKAGSFVKTLQEQLVCQGQVQLHQVQADELCVKVQGKKVWVATAIEVFSRLFLWGEVGLKRDKGLVERLLHKVRSAAASVTTPLLFAVDGFAAYPKAILKIFHVKEQTGQRGRPRHLPWPKLNIVQVVKQRTGYKLKSISRRVLHGCRDQAFSLIALSQCDLGQFNTAYIERLNATFRARMPSLNRRTRHLARTLSRIEVELFWSGVVYNFCTVHTSLGATPAMAAALTDHVWSIQELLCFKLPVPLLHDTL